MEPNNRTKLSWWSEMSDSHTLELRDPKTMKTLKSWQVSKARITVVVIGLAMLIAGAVACLFLFTPLRTLVPGYQDILRDETYLELEEQIGELEEYIEAQDVYLSNLSLRLRGDVEDLSIPGDNLVERASTVKPTERVKEDEELRKEMARERVLRKQNSKSNRNPSELYLTTPVKGQVSAPFMPDQKHYGLDIVAPANSPILAAAEGYVIFADWTHDKGNTIGLMHDQNIVTFYMHNSTLLKAVGDYVEAGEAVAIIGNSGELTDGPHVHFEIWQEGKPIDPQDHITP